MRFYVNKMQQINGDHEVHTAICLFLPREPDRVDLGEFYTCATAIDKAREIYKTANGCYFCSRLCHEK